MVDVENGTVSNIVTSVLYHTSLYTGWHTKPPCIQDGIPNTKSCIEGDVTGMHLDLERRG